MLLGKESILTLDNPKQLIDLVIFKISIFNHADGVLTCPLIRLSENLQGTCLQHHQMTQFRSLVTQLNMKDHPFWEK